MDIRERAAAAWAEAQAEAERQRLAEEAARQARHQALTDETRQLAEAMFGEPPESADGTDVTVAGLRLRREWASNHAYFVPLPTCSYCGKRGRVETMRVSSLAGLGRALELLAGAEWLHAECQRAKEEGRSKAEAEAQEPAQREHTPPPEPTWAERLQLLLDERYGRADGGEAGDNPLWQDYQALKAAWAAHLDGQRGHS